MKFNQGKKVDSRSEVVSALEKICGVNPEAKEISYLSIHVFLTFRSSRLQITDYLCKFQGKNI